MQMNGDSSGSGLQSEINITPLVDVVLVLLIIFMVLTPMLIRQLGMHVPERDRGQPVTEAGPLPVVIRVDGHERLFVGEEELPPPALAERLRSLLANRLERDRVVFFDAPDTLPYGKAAAVMDLIRGASASAIVPLVTPLARPNDQPGASAAAEAAKAAP